MNLLPTSMIILGRSWTLALLDEEHIEELWGLCLGSESEIQLSPWTQLDVQRESLLHEIIHAIDCAISLDLTERQVKRLSQVMFDTLFVRNAGVRRFLSGSSE